MTEVLMETAFVKYVVIQWGDSDRLENFNAFSECRQEGFTSLCSDV